MPGTIKPTAYTPTPCVFWGEPALSLEENDKGCQPQIPPPSAVKSTFVGWDYWVSLVKKKKGRKRGKGKRRQRKTRHCVPANALSRFLCPLPREALSFSLNAPPRKVPWEPVPTPAIPSVNSSRSAGWCQILFLCLRDFNIGQHAYESWNPDICPAIDCDPQWQAERDSRQGPTLSHLFPGATLFHNFKKLSLVEKIYIR